jgi:hypothetical protein
VRRLRDFRHCGIAAEIAESPRNEHSRVDQQRRGRIIANCIDPVTLNMFVLGSKSSTVASVLLLNDFCPPRIMTAPFGRLVSETAWCARGELMSLAVGEK